MPDSDYVDFIEAVRAADAIRDDTSIPPYVREDAEICALRAAVEAAASILSINLTP